MEKTFLMVKPDGVQRNLIGEIVSRFEKERIPISWSKTNEYSCRTCRTTLRRT